MKVLLLFTYKSVLFKERINYSLRLDRGWLAQWFGGSFHSISVWHTKQYMPLMLSWINGSVQRINKWPHVLIAQWTIQVNISHGLLWLNPDGSGAVLDLLKAIQVVIELKDELFLVFKISGISLIYWMETMCLCSFRWAKPCHLMRLQPMKSWGHWMLIMSWSSLAEWLATQETTSTSSSGWCASQRGSTPETSGWETSHILSLYLVTSSRTQTTQRGACCTC